MVQIHEKLQHTVVVGLGAIQGLKNTQISKNQNIKSTSFQIHANKFYSKK